MLQLNQFKRKYAKHPLFDSNRFKENTFFTDPKTEVKMQVRDQPFQSFGAGLTRNLGIVILENQPAGKILAISKNPLELMDLQNFTRDEYIANSWYIHGLFTQCFRNVP